MNPIEKGISPEKEFTELMAQLNAECSELADIVSYKMKIIGIDFLFVKVKKSLNLAIHNIDGRICFYSDRRLNDKNVWEQIDKNHGISLNDYGYFIPADRKSKIWFVAYKYDILSELDAEMNKAIAELKEFFDC